MNWLLRLFSRELDQSDDRDHQSVMDAKRQEAMKFLDRPTCKRIDMEQWKSERVRRRARETM